MSEKTGQEGGGIVELKSAVKKALGKLIHPQGRHRIIEAGQPLASERQLPTPSTEGQERHRHPRRRERSKSAEQLSLYKIRFALIAEELIDEGDLPRTEYLEKRLAKIRHIPILVTYDRRQEFHYYDPEEDEIKLKYFDDNLNTDHEMTHALLPEIKWRMLNEGITQKVAREINKRMQHEGGKPQHDFYNFNEQIVDNVERLSGFSMQQLIAMASDPMIPDLIEEINSRAQILVGGKLRGVIEYGMELEGKALVDLTLAESKGPSRTPKEKDEFVAQKIAEGLNKAEPLVPDRS